MASTQDSTRALESQPLLPLPKISERSWPSSAELWGYSYMLVAAFAWSMMAFGVHIGSTYLHFPTIPSILVRGIVNLLLSFAFIMITRPPTLWQANSQLFPLISRTVVGTLGCLCIFSSVKYLPVGDAVTIFSTSPAITTLLSAVFLHEPFTTFDGGALVASFTGVILVARPSFLFGVDNNIVSTDADAYINSSLGLVFATGAAFCASAVYTLIRSMGTRIHFILNTVAMGIGLTSFPLVFLSSDDLHHMLYNYQGLAIIIAASLAGFVCVACFSRSLQLCRAGPGMIIRTMDIPFSFLLGFIFLAESMSWMKLFGVLLIFGAAICTGLRELTSPIRHLGAARNDDTE